jgi:DNA-binding transcriptional regulator GbsR (MarR family)
VTARHSKKAADGAARSGAGGPSGQVVPGKRAVRPRAGGPSGQVVPGKRAVQPRAVAPARAAAPGGPNGAGLGRRDPAAVRQFIERFTGQLTQAGFPRTPARIFVALLTSDSSQLTAAELGDLLQASPASVSGGVRYLIQVGIVVAEGEPGSRRQHYRMPEDVWQDIVRLRDRQFSRWAAELSEGVEVLGARSPAGARMADTVRYFEFISAEISGLLAGWSERKSTIETGASHQDQ